MGIKDRLFFSLRSFSPYKQKCCVATAKSKPPKVTGDVDEPSRPLGGAENGFWLERWSQSRLTSEGRLFSIGKATRERREEKRGHFQDARRSQTRGIFGDKDSRLDERKLSKGKTVSGKKNITDSTTLFLPFFSKSTLKSQEHID